MTLIGLDITHKALFTRAHADRLRGTGRAGKAVAELSDFFQIFHESRYALRRLADPRRARGRGGDRPVARDDASSATSRSRRASECCDGRTVVDRWNVTDRPRRTADAGIDVDAERFLELLVERISALA